MLTGGRAARREEDSGKPGCLWAVGAAIARLGSSSEPFDLGVVMSPLSRAGLHTWTTPLARST
jgi:hypothetical protein